MSKAKTPLEHWEVDPKILRLIKLMNWSILSFLLLPLGNLIVPILFWQKHKAESLIDQLGRKMINAQILWTITTSVALGLAFLLPLPNLLGFSAMQCLAAGLIVSNLFLIFKTARALQQNNFDFLHFRINLI